MAMMLDYIPESDVKQMHEATCQLLEECGVRVSSQRFMDAASSVGLIVEKDPAGGNHLVKFKRDQIEQAIEAAPKKWSLYGIDPKYEVRLGEGLVYSQTCIGTPFIRDIETGERRNTTLEDEIDFIRMQDALPDIDVASYLTAQGIPEHAGVAIQVAAMVKNTAKPMMICSATYAEVEQTARILYAVAGGKEKFIERPFAYLEPSPKSPLEYGSGPADALIGIIEEGLPVGIIPCPMMGATGPMTVIGSVVQHNAEMLAGVVITELLKPGLPIVMSPRVTFMDMSTAMGLWAAPEMGLANSASVALTRYYGIPSEPGGFSCAAKIVDAQAGFEVAYNVLALALEGADMIGSAGSLDNALIASFEKLVMDNEVASMAKRAVRGEVIDEDTLAVDVIKKVMETGKHDFLNQKHTRKHVRSELWKPLYSDRSLYAHWDEERLTFTQVANREAKRILAEHHPNHLSDEQVAAIDAIVEECIAADPSKQVH